MTWQPCNGKSFVQTSEKIWTSQWSVILRTFYRQILSLLYSSFFFWNFRHRLARELLVWMDPKFVGVLLFSCFDSKNRWLWAKALFDTPGFVQGAQRKSPFIDPIHTSVFAPWSGEFHGTVAMKASIFTNLSSIKTGCFIFMLFTKELLKIGIGPSSSHTVGPMPLGSAATGFSVVSLCFVGIE